MEWYHVYLFTRLDSIGCVLTALWAATLIAIAVVGIVFICSEGEVPDKEIVEKYWKKCVGWLLVITFIAVMTPSQKEAAAIYLLPKLAHSDFAKEAQQIPTDAAKLMRLKLEAWIADMEPKKDK